MRSFSLPFCVAFAIFSIRPALGGLTKGPYLQDVRTDSIVVAFEADSPVQGAVEYGLDENYGGIVSSMPATHHAIRIEGLKPGQFYHYRVLLDGVPVGQPGTFSTAPEKNLPFSFLAYGDNRSDANAHRLVVSRMLEHPVAFLINTGDLVSKGDREDQWQEFFEIEADLIRFSPLYVAVGNHEVVNHAVPKPFLRLFVPAKGAEEHPTYYSFRYSNVLFIVLDGFAETEPSVECFFMIRGFGECFKPAQVEWLLEELNRAAAEPAIEHVIVVTHEGPYSSKPGRTGSGHMRALLPVFAESKVSLILSGHDHYYEHGISANLIHYVVTGGGGAPLYETVGPGAPVAYPHKVLVSTSVYNFVRVDVDGERLYVTAYDAEGTVIEDFEIAALPSCDKASDCAALAPGTCEGQWVCGRLGRCVWLCPPPPECSVVEDCLWRGQGECPGGWQCIDGTCEWVCEVKPDCETDADCKERPGLTECDGGAYACVNGMCEWTCPASSLDSAGSKDLGQAGDFSPSIPYDQGIKAKGGGCSAQTQVSLGPVIFWAILFFFTLRKSHRGSGLWFSLRSL